MSLRKPDVIDILMRDPADGSPELLMVDSGDIRDEQERHQRFVDKLAAYAAFVDHGGYRERFPDAEAGQVRVRVVCSWPPNGSMQGVQSVILREHAGVRLPVVFELEEEMRRRIQRFAGGSAPQPARKPWWRFW